MVAADVEALFTPLKIGDLALRNRIVMASLTRWRSVPSNVPNEVNVESEWQNAPGIWGADHVAAWKKVVNAVHAQGGLIFCQLWHLGRVSHPDAPAQKATGTPVYAPSAKAARGGKFRFLPGSPGYVTPTEIPDPTTLVEAFKRAAINAKEAGFDVHGANGYLVHEFLDSTSNLRTDAWGGSVEKRTKFGLDVLNALIDVWGPGKVGIKLSPAGGYNDMGMPLQETIETFTYFVEQVDSLPMAYILFQQYVPMLDPVIDGKLRATQHEVLATYRPYVKNNIVSINGGLTPHMGVKLVKEGKADFAMFGLLHIGHPDLATRIQHGKPLDAEISFAQLYGQGPQETLDEIRKGYTDYPEASYVDTASTRTREEIASIELPARIQSYSA